MQALRRQQQQQQLSYFYNKFTAIFSFFFLINLAIESCQSFQFSSPSSHGATVSPFSESLSMVSGTGRECRTMAPYRPYSAMMDALPQHFSVLRHLARRFWNHTYGVKKRILIHQICKCKMSHSPRFERRTFPSMGKSLRALVPKRRTGSSCSLSRNLLWNHRR